MVVSPMFNSILDVNSVNKLMDIFSLYCLLIEKYPNINSILLMHNINTSMIEKMWVCNKIPDCDSNLLLPFKKKKGSRGRKFGKREVAATGLFSGSFHKLSLAHKNYLIWNSNSNHSSKPSWNSFIWRHTRLVHGYLFSV